MEGTFLFGTEVWKQSCDVSVEREFGPQVGTSRRESTSEALAKLGHTLGTQILEADSECDFGKKRWTADLAGHI